MEFETNPLIIDEEELDYITRSALYNKKNYKRDPQNANSHITFALYNWFDCRCDYGDINILTEKGLQNLIDEIEKRIKEKEKKDE